LDPGGKYLYVASANDFIDAFDIDTISGGLTPLPGSPFKLRAPSNCSGLNPYDIIDPAGKYLYTADIFADSISGFAIGSTAGVPTELAGSPWPDEGGCNVPVLCQSCAFNPMSLAVDGTGKFMDGLNSDTEEIAIYSISSNGALTFMKYTPKTGACYGPIRADAGGNYVYAVSLVALASRQAPRRWWVSRSITRPATLRRCRHRHIRIQ
jgi:DNA-binding beta-propeller fold protein YncE